MKKSFVLYTDYNEQLKLLTSEQKGILFQAIMDYVITGEFEISDPIVRMLFSIIKTRLDADNEKYNKVCEKNRENINKRWEKYKGIQPNTNEYERTFSYYDNDNDNDNDNDIYSFSLSNIEAFCRDERLKNINPKAFFDYYSKKKWICNGKPIRDWKSLIRTWNSNIKSKGFQQRDYDYEELEKEVLAN